MGAFTHASGMITLESVLDLMRAQPDPVETTSPLVAIFREKSIRIVGTVNDPLFCAADVAAHVGDIEHYSRRIKTFIAGEHFTSHEMTDSRGHCRKMMFLTEFGLYKYLIQARGAIADEFQRFVFNLLRDERKRTVDSLQLALKITKSQLEESQREKAMILVNEEKIYRAANDARTLVLEQTKEIAKLRKAQYDLEDANFMKQMGRSHLMNRDDAGY